MVFKRPLAIVCLSIACGKGHDFAFYDAASGNDASSTGTNGFKVACSDSGFTIDGLFTGFTASNSVGTKSLSLYEWGGITPVQGKYTYMYSAACSTGSSYVLYFINDWYTNAKGPIAKACFNRFDFFDPGSGTALELRVYGDHHVQVFENGSNVTYPAMGHAGFASSPNV